MNKKKEKFDKLVLGDGVEFSTDSSETGVNNNIAVVGGSGSGKTWSVVLKRIIDTKNGNLIVTTAKDRLYDLTAGMMEARGYNVKKLDLVYPEKSTCYWNLLDMLSSWQSVTQFATDIVYANKKRKENTSVDPYWDECAISLLSSLIGYTMCTKENAEMRDVLELFYSIKIKNGMSGNVELSINHKFEAFERKAGNQHFVTRTWKTISLLPERTLRCVIGSLATTLDKTFSSDLLKIMSYSDGKENFDINSFSQEKSILYLNTSPYNINLNYLLNIFYANLFQSFFEIAEEMGGTLSIPMQVILDDFAVGGEINGFEQYISVMREAKMSVLLLLQSEGQLEKIYGEASARTILDNCDTTLYMGSNCLVSTKNMAQKIDKPLAEVLSMPIGKEVIIRRGEKPKFYINRYPILDDLEYKRLIVKSEKQKKQERADELFRERGII